MNELPMNSPHEFGSIKLPVSLVTIPGERAYYRDADGLYLSDERVVAALNDSLRLHAVAVAAKEFRALDRSQCSNPRCVVPKCVAVKALDTALAAWEKA